ncbi:hypothetical protein F4782DRAFT_493613 [Xylaria castorea]|nr:hypothetical protein F4782DRAFT_493613 [Xylaria castorea]
MHANWKPYMRIACFSAPMPRSFVAAGIAPTRQSSNICRFPYVLLFLTSSLPAKVAVLIGHRVSTLKYVRYIGVFLLFSFETFALLALECSHVLNTRSLRSC